METKIEYTLTFSEALDLMIEKGYWVKGNDFAKSCYIKIDTLSKIVLVDVERFGIESEFPYITSLYKQKYRVIKFSTIKELSR